MSAYEDRDRYEQEEQMDKFFQDSLRAMVEEPVKFYLATHGDAIEERVLRCEEEAKELATAGFHGAALARFVTAIEITFRFFLARPLVQGAFLSEEWASVLSEKFTGPTHKDRKLLPSILRNWGIDPDLVKLADGSQAWEQISKVYERRDLYTHEGEMISKEDAQLAGQCLQSMLTNVVEPLAVRLGFTREKTGRWSIIASPNPSMNPPSSYATRSPFGKR